MIRTDKARNNACDKVIFKALKDGHTIEITAAEDTALSELLVVDVDGYSFQLHSRYKSSSRLHISPEMLKCLAGTAEVLRISEELIGGMLDD